MKLSMNIDCNYQVKSLSDLPKFKEVMENLNMKINKSKIAREMGVDRRTVDKYLNGFSPKIKRSRKSKISKYYEDIKYLLSEECPQRFFYKNMLWRYLTKEKGLECAESTFRGYISRVPEFNDYFKYDNKIPTPSGTPRFETKYGKQAQFDWKENIQFLTKEGEKVEFNVAVLLFSRSRFRIMQVSLSKKQEVLTNFFTTAFEQAGGVPEELVTDNLKTVMHKPRTENSSGEVNLKFQSFAKDFNLEVKPCIAGRPRTKGKVESSMKLLDEIYAYQGKLAKNEIPSFIENLNKRINMTLHQGIGNIPLLEFQKEKKLLQPLPHEKIRASYKINHKHVKVNKSNMITYKSNQYSVPPEYYGRIVELQVYDHWLYVYYNTDLIAHHPISTKKLNYHQEDYVETLKTSINKDRFDIDDIALENLNIIGEMYDD